VWNCLAVFELRHWRLMLLLSAASANDFVEGIVVMCELNVVGMQSSEAHADEQGTGSSLSDAAIDSRADADFTSTTSNNFLYSSSNTTMIFATLLYVFDLLSIQT
jgi:hypothetical protein